MITSDIVAEFIRRVCKNEHHEAVAQDLEKHVRLVSEKGTYDAHGNYEQWCVYSVALNDETRDVQYVQTYRYVESGEQDAYRVQPMTYTKTAYLRVK